ncbi:MAG: putative serine/threonine-protein kinase Nek6 [Streblomastix strix]|uniref:non-specific serine/threonine protein kinase n=1 Tax=Streblomastix strix TaxID=222440 RepID=A0A5J4VWM4_9EUKA|nr:MAG: putative serine/threonine-protein kinase Nek6 [Streblomastix strix]
MSSIKDYKIISKLPGGAQSKTFIVELKSTHQQFIMKKVDYLEQVDRAKVDIEVELMRSLDSDFTVRLVCVFPDPMEIELCMILEYCVRGDFRNIIDEFQQLPQSEKLMRGWEYTAQITRALDHLHSHNVMHRDLKPANILVNQDGTIRLGDFGLSREMNEDYYLTIAGTKVYMAPEVHLLKIMNKSSDMFSLGVIIFQLITGHHPYEADSEEAMIDKIKKNKVSELPDWVSNQMKEVIKWMMNQNENHRPTTKMILSHDTVLMYLRSCEDREQLKQEKIEALNERDVLIQERNGLQSDNERALAERDRERIEKDQLQIELNRERIEKEKYKQEADQQKRRADTTQSEVIRLTAEVQRLSQSIQSFPPSLNPNMLIGIIPNKEHAYQQGLKIIHKNNWGQSTVAFNPIISSGIVRFGGFFENHPVANFSIGIADSSAVFGSNERPYSGENEKKTVCYWRTGEISHIGYSIPGNSRIESNKSVSCEVNMNISPRTLTFFYENKEQGLSVRNIPSSIRFYIFLYKENSSFTINRFENVQYSSAKGVSNGKVFEWGKEWKKVNK